MFFEVVLAGITMYTVNEVMEKDKKEVKWEQAISARETSTINKDQTGGHTDDKLKPANTNSGDISTGGDDSNTKT